MSEKSNKYVFGLDIGTRSCVGIVGYIDESRKFHVCAQSIFEHEPRAMMDGQIHDISKVSETIKKVKEDIEKRYNFSLDKACIAAAGRVLRTVTVSTCIEFEEEKNILSEDIFSLCTQGIEAAYEKFSAENDTDMNFYCVGYTPMRFYMNGYAIGNLENHKAKSISVDLIATFLPDDVIDSLYKAVEGAGLEVLNLTLEPIAAMCVAIPERFRTLNMALVDVGAGTSDISLTKDGSIVAYGMIPKAGDCFTNEIANHCFVEFDTAEHIKKSSGVEDIISYDDIMLLPQTITSEEVLDIIAPVIEDITTEVGDNILELNGGKPVGACFVVGGGGKVKGFTDKLAEKIGIPKERVAIRGEEVMRDIIFDIDNPVKDSTIVTPIGIAISFYDKTSSFIFVNFNGKNIKLYDNNNLKVTDCALQASFPNEDLFPKSGEALVFTVNGKPRMIRGSFGEPAKILVNNMEANMHTPIRNSDVISIVPSEKGEPAKAKIKDLAEMKEKMQIFVNGNNFMLDKKSFVNGSEENLFCDIHSGDDIEIQNFYLVSDVLKQLDIDKVTDIRINDVIGDENSRIYEGFSITFAIGEKESVASIEEEITNDIIAPDIEFEKEEKNDCFSIDQDGQNDSVSQGMLVWVNGKPVRLAGKEQFVFVDVFDYIDFDLKASAGRNIITTVNGNPAQYMQPLNQNDVIVISWQV